MDINALNPAEEIHLIMEESLYEQIYQAVMDAQGAWENALINRGHDDVDDAAPVEPSSTLREMLEVISVIKRHTKTSNSPLARILESNLASYIRQIRVASSQAEASTHITDYFTRK